MKKLQNYSKEMLASMIADEITFEDSPVFVFQGLDIDFKGVSAIVHGLANSYVDTGGITTMDTLEVYECTLYFDDGAETHFNLSEIEDLVTEIKRWK